MSVPKSILGAVVAIILMVVGAFGPWAHVVGITINGTTGGRDGWLVIGAAAVAVVVLLILLAKPWRWLALVSLAAGAAAAATAAYDVEDINSFGGGIATAQWGVYIALVGSILLIVCSIWMIVEIRRAPTTEIEEPAVSEPPVAPQA